MKIDFYNLQKIPYEDGLFKIAQKAYNSGEKVIIKTKDKKSMEEIDKLLWEHNNEAWIPHDFKNPEHQPILLSQEINNLNNASILIITDCSEIPYNSNFSRCLYVFNGNNNENLNQARKEYKLSLEKNIDLQYHNL